MPRLRRLARSLCRNAADADDLVQTTVERALGRRGQWQAGTRLDWWTMRIMRNAFIDDRRRSGRAALVVEPEAFAGLADQRQAGADVRADALSLDQAVKRLPPEQRIAVALVLVEGFSYGEAAEILELPPGTLASRVARGREGLLAQLNPESGS